MKGPLYEYARDLQNGKIQEDTSYVYSLPYRKGESHRIIQGYYTANTHKYRAALDFRMKIGTPVLAARKGLVVRVKDDSDLGGFKKKYRPMANAINIQHEDGTVASYRHLKYKGALVKLGDSVKVGQLIAYSGNTGYTFTPHLHFMVTKRINDQTEHIPTRFATANGITYLRPYKKYKNK